MENIIERCAICGCCWFIGELERRWCLECSSERDDRKAIVYKSTKPQEYYEELSRKEYGDSTHWEEIFVREELSKNPRFSQEYYELNLIHEEKRKKNREEQEARSKRLKDMREHPEEYGVTKEDFSVRKNVPTCPTCGSTNLKKITELNRAVSVFAWGLASSKIGKQFECKNCGYKW